MMTLRDKIETSLSISILQRSANKWLNKVKSRNIKITGIVLLIYLCWCMMAFNTNINTKLKTRVYELYEPFEKGLEKIIVGESSVHHEEENKIDINTNRNPIWQTNTVVGGILTEKLRKNKTVLPLEDDSNADEIKNVIPRKIWMMWDQGLDNAPLSVKQCHESWVKKNPDHTVQMLTLKEGEELVGIKNKISNAMWNFMQVQHKSDMIRSLLLMKFGGIWVDASVLCVKPLSEWFDYSKPFVTFVRHDNGTREAKFLLNGKPIIDPWITNWFMAAGGKGKTQVMEKIARKFAAYWNDKNKIHGFYFAYHSIVAHLYNTDPNFRQLVGEPEDAAGPHCISGNPLEQKMLKRCWQNLKPEVKGKLLNF